MAFHQALGYTICTLIVLFGMFLWRIVLFKIALCFRPRRKLNFDVIGKSRRGNQGNSQDEKGIESTPPRSAEDKSKSGYEDNSDHDYSSYSEDGCCCCLFEYEEITDSETYSNTTGFVAKRRSGNHDLRQPTKERTSEMVTFLKGDGKRTTYNQHPNVRRRHTATVRQVIKAHVPNNEPICYPTHQPAFMRSSSEANISRTVLGHTNQSTHVNPLGKVVSNHRFQPSSNVPAKHPNRYQHPSKVQECDRALQRSKSLPMDAVKRDYSYVTNSGRQITNQAYPSHSTNDPRSQAQKPNNYNSSRSRGHRPESKKMQKNTSCSQDIKRYAYTNTSIQPGHSVNTGMQNGFMCHVPPLGDYKGVSNNQNFGSLYLISENHFLQEEFVPSTNIRQGALPVLPYNQVGLRGEYL